LQRRSEADDSYILENPDFVKEACLAIRRYYKIADLAKPIYTDSS